MGNFRAPARAESSPAHKRVAPGMAMYDWKLVEWGFFFLVLNRWPLCSEAGRRLGTRKVEWGDSLLADELVI